MRQIDCTSRKHLQECGRARIYTIYDNIDEAVANGVPREEILLNWRFLEKYEPLVNKIKSGDVVWVKSDDEFIPSHYDYTDGIVPLLIDGKIVKTTGCIVEVYEYRSTKYSDYIRTPTGSFLFTSKRLTTEIRRSPYSFSAAYRPLGESEKISKRKVKIIMDWLSPASPFYGNLLGAFLNTYSNYKKHRIFVQHEIVAAWIDQPWFYKLLKRNFIVKTLFNDMTGELRKQGIDDKFLAEKVKKAFVLAEDNKDAKALLAAVREVRAIFAENPQNKPNTPVEPVPDALGGSAPAPALPTPHIDNGDTKEAVFTEVKPTEEKKQEKSNINEEMDDEDIATEAERFVMMGGGGQTGIGPENVVGGANANS